MTIRLKIRSKKATRSPSLARMLAIELIIQLILAADKYRADELDVHSLEAEVDTDLWRMDAWAAEQVEPDAGRQETIAMIMEARVILMEAHLWPLAEIEESAN